MLALLKVFVDIALWRKGPQHLPASGLLLAVTVAINIATSAAIGSVAQASLLKAQQAADPTAVAATPMLMAPMLLELTLTLCWIALLLGLFRHLQRFLQTATAWVGMDVVISPLVVLTGVLVARFGPTSAIALPVGLAMIAATVWYVLVIAHVVRSALEISLFPALMLALAYIASAYFVATSVFGTPS